MATKLQLDKVLQIITEQTDLSYQDAIEKYCEFLRKNLIKVESNTEWCSDATLQPDYWNSFIMHINHRPTTILVTSIRKQDFDL